VGDERFETQLGLAQGADHVDLGEPPVVDAGGEEEESAHGDLGNVLA